MCVDAGASAPLAEVPAFAGRPHGPSLAVVGDVAAKLLSGADGGISDHPLAERVARWQPALERANLTPAALQHAVGPDVAVVIRLLSLRVRAVDGATKDAAVAGAQFWRAPAWGQLGLLAHRVAMLGVAQRLGMDAPRALAAELAALAEALRCGGPPPPWPQGWADALVALVHEPDLVARGDAGTVSSACHALATASILAPRKT